MVWIALILVEEVDPLVHVLIVEDGLGEGFFVENDLL